MNRFTSPARWSLTLSMALAGTAMAADPFAFSSIPLFLAPGVKPNVMVILDNSQSMDGTMGGKVVSGNDAATRSNIARGVLKSVLDTHLGSFNWGLATFETTNSKLYNTQAYFLGNDTTMAYRHDCNATSLPPGVLGCMPNPQFAANGVEFIT
jgi:type IV pilus assembly protein PilY1